MTPSLDLWRLGICELARWACGAPELTIGKLHPRYREIVENRDQKQDWKYYSSCGDLAFWIAKRCGVREAWVNRDDDNVHGPWELAKNVAKLAIASTAPRADYKPGLGDIWILSNTWPAGTDSHVCACLGPNPEKPGEYLSANYGAGGLSPVEFPGAKVASHALADPGGRLRYHGKLIAEVLEVPDLVARVSAKPDFSGPAWSSTWTGEVRDALEASAP